MTTTRKPVQDLVIDYLREHGPHAGKEVAWQLHRQFGCNENTVRQVIARLYADGVLYRSEPAYGLAGDKSKKGKA